MAPKKHPDEVRGTPIAVRFTNAEAQFVREQAASAGLDLSSYLRELALLDHSAVREAASRAGIPVQAYIVSRLRPAASRRAAADPSLVSELNRVGVNLNQLAKAHNRGDAFLGAWRELADTLHAVLEKVLRHAG